MSSKRLFTALRFPEETIQQISRVQELLKNTDPKARYVKPISNFHLTLYFIGMTENEDAARDGLYNACERYKLEDGSPIDLNFTQLGTFKNRQGPLVWLGIENNEHLQLLARLIPEELNKAGIEAKFKKYKPHITLARKFHGDLNIDFELPEPIQCSKAALVWSRHNAEDVLVYDNLFQFPFTMLSNS